MFFNQPKQVQSQDGQKSKLKKTNHGKLMVMVIFLAFDLALNSTLDYDNYESTDPNNKLVLGLFGLQIVIQISVFLILFLTVADTFLFRVGLLNILLRKIRFVLIIQILYFILTIITGLRRVHLYDQHNSLLFNVKNQSFTSLSIAQKLIGVAYYIVNFNSTVKLEDPIYYNKDAWINLIKQVRYFIYFIFFDFFLLINSILIFSY